MLPPESFRSHCHKKKLIGCLPWQATESAAELAGLWLNTDQPEVWHRVRERNRKHFERTPMALTRRWRRAIIVISLFVATWIYIIFSFIYNSADEDSPWSTASGADRRVDTPTDFDGTASACRCRDVGRTRRTRFWPPLETQDLLCPRDGTYDVTVCVDHLDETGSQPRNKLTERLAILKSKHPYVPLTGSELRQWYKLEEPRLRQQYELYPMAVNISEITKNISLGLPVTTKPITNPNIKLLRVSQSICPPGRFNGNPISRYKLVVVYKSGIYNFDDRLKLRAQYSQLRKVFNHRVGVVFSVGMPRSTGENVFHMKGFSLQLPERAGSVLREWSGRSREALRRVYEEADIYDDLIIGDYEDTYVNLTYKMITSYRWVSAFCRGKADIFLFLDDDYRFNANNVLSYLDTLQPREQTRLLAGPLMSWRKVLRPFKDPFRNKWALTFDEVPWSDFPPYFCGASYLVGMDVIHDMVIAAAYTRWLWVDDVFLGFVITKLPYTSRSLKGFSMEFVNHHKALVYHSPTKFTLKMLLDNLYQLRNTLHI
ncbi:unnamed protein product [Schistocephalus solidus]|uniref:Hexosyltransferase n=1 Tax=Schistocephalus solidus TaxID=70667 RepID=A0A183TAJ0_SCHSO|nr:unnamed protein product [Schistocephalus solidus]